MSVKPITEYAGLALIAADLLRDILVVFSKENPDETDAERLERAVANFQAKSAEFDAAVDSLRRFAETMPIED